MKITKLLPAAAVALAAVLALGGCQGDNSNQAKAQDMTGKAGKKLKVGDDYPLSDMHYPTDEQQNVREKLKRLNNPNKIGYVAIITQSGQVLASYTIKGKVSSTGSQLLNTQDTTNCDGNSNNCAVVSSLGDDGTYGPEECETGNGVFFFDTRNVLHVMCLGSSTLFYADAPENFTNVPILTEGANVTPSSTGGEFK